MNMNLRVADRLSLFCARYGLPDSHASPPTSSSLLAVPPGSRGVEGAKELEPLSVIARCETRSEMNGHAIRIQAVPDLLATKDLHPKLLAIQTLSIRRA